MVDRVAGEVHDAVVVEVEVLRLADDVVRRLGDGDGVAGEVCRRRCRRRRRPRRSRPCRRGRCRCDFGSVPSAVLSSRSAGRRRRRRFGVIGEVGALGFEFGAVARVRAAQALVPSGTPSLSVSHEGPLSAGSVPIGAAGLPSSLSSFVMSPPAGFGWPSEAPENGAQMPLAPRGSVSCCRAVRRCPCPYRRRRRTCRRWRSSRRRRARRGRCRSRRYCRRAG